MSYCTGIVDKQVLELMRNFILRSCKLIIVLTYPALVPMCFAGKVQVWMDKNIDFSQYKTYQWLPPKLLTKGGVVEDDASFAEIIKNAINRELTQKGLRQVAQGGDLEVSTLALRQAIAQLEGFIFPGDAPDFFTAPVATMSRYNHEGTLVVNLIDAKTQKSAWCGMAKETIGRNYGAGKKKIAPAAAKMFKKYPKSATKK